jgi:ABC-type methionine transport system permease subunit
VLVDVGLFTAFIAAMFLAWMICRALIVSYEAGDLAPKALPAELDMWKRIIADVTKAYAEFVRDMQRVFLFGYYLLVYLLLWHSMAYSRLDRVHICLELVVWLGGSVALNVLLLSTQPFVTRAIYSGTVVFWAGVFALWLGLRLACTRFKQIFKRDRSGVKKVRFRWDR